MHTSIVLLALPTFKLGANGLEFALPNLCGVPFKAPPTCVVHSSLEFALSHHCKCLEKQQPYQLQIKLVSWSRVLLNTPLMINAFVIT
jgi:hypothetical protein